MREIKGTKISNTLLVETPVGYFRQAFIEDFVACEIKPTTNAIYYVKMAGLEFVQDLRDFAPSVMVNRITKEEGIVYGLNDPLNQINSAKTFTVLHTTDFPVADENAEYVFLTPIKVAVYDPHALRG
jgi:hypothetical protein